MPVVGTRSDLYLSFLLCFTVAQFICCKVLDSIFCLGFKSYFILPQLFAFLFVFASSFKCFKVCDSEFFKIIFSPFV